MTPRKNRTVKVIAGSGLGTWDLSVALKLVINNRRLTTPCLCSVVRLTIENYIQKLMEFTLIKYTITSFAARRESRFFKCEMNVV